MLQLDKIELYITDDNGQTFDLSQMIISYHLRWSLFESIGSFDAEISPHSPWIPKFLGKDRFLWKVCDRPMLTGYIDSIEQNWSKDTHSLKITGRDILSVLADNSFLHAGQYQKRKMEDIIDDVFTQKMAEKIPAVGNFNSLSLVSFSKEGDPGYRFTTSAKQTLAKMNALNWINYSTGQTYYDFISKLLNTAGLFLFVEPGSRTVTIHSFYTPSTGLGSTSTSASNFNYDGEISSVTTSPYQLQHTKNGVGNVKEFTVRNDRSKYYNYVKIVGSANSDGTIYANGSVTSLKQELRGYDTALTRIKTVVQNDADEIIWKKIPNQLTYNIALIQSSHVFQWRFKLPNHSMPNTNEPFFINRTAELWDEFIFSENNNELSCFVTGVEYEGGKDMGQSTQMTLLPKDYVLSLIDTNNPLYQIKL